MINKIFPIYSSWLKNAKTLKELPTKCLAVNTGSTAGYNAFDYNFWKVNGANLGFPPQPLYYDFEMLKKYSNHIAEHATVFICLELFKFYLNYYEDVKADYKYYFWLDNNQIRTFKKTTNWLLHRAPIFLTYKEIFSFLKKILKKILLRDRNKNSDNTEAKDIENSKLMTEGWNKEFGWENGQFVTEDQLKTISIVENRLIDMIDYCVNNNWSPCIVVLPLSPNLKKRLSDNVMNPGLWEPLKRIKRLRNVKIIDYYNDERFAHWQLYKNALSLNDKGRSLFNNLVQQTIFQN